MKAADAQAPASGVSTWRSRLGLPLWSLAAPLLGLAALGAGLAKMGPLGQGAAALLLFSCVLAAVHHAEVVAHKVGEPFGTLVLAVAVTVIEVALIVSLMVSGAGDASSLARDTVFAAVMIILNGIIGVCLLAGAARHHEQTFTLEGAVSALGVLAAMAVLSLVLPNFTVSAPGPAYSTSQLVFTAVVSLILYGAFVVVQTVRHRDYFLPADEACAPEDHAPPPSGFTTAAAFGTLLVALVVVVFLAKALSARVEQLVVSAGLPLAVVGVVIAALVLAPESLAAYRAARRDRLQTSLNLALGSALATIGLTIPAVSVVSIMLGLPLNMGVGSKGLTLLVLSLFVTGLSLSTGRTTVLQGAVHLVIFAAYLFTTIVP